MIVVSSYVKCNDYIYQYDNGQLQVAPGCSQEETLEVSECSWNEEVDGDYDDIDNNYVDDIDKNYIGDIDDNFKSFDDDHLAFRVSSWTLCLRSEMKRVGHAIATSRRQTVPWSCPLQGQKVIQMKLYLEWMLMRMSNYDDG